MHTILGDLNKKYETLGTTRSALWEKYDSAHATRPGVVPKTRSALWENWQSGHRLSQDYFCATRGTARLFTMQFAILGDLNKKCETLATTRSALWEKYESAHATRPGVVPHYTLRSVGELAIWPPVVFDISLINLRLLLHKNRYYTLHARLFVMQFARFWVFRTKSTKH